MERKKRILIVDDSDIDRMMLRTMLCGQFEVIQMSNGFAAAEYVKENQGNLDVVLLDISMPVMDGFDVLEVMQEEMGANPPVILITSEATMDNVQKARQFGISNFMKKPFKRADLMTRIYQQLGIVVEYKLSNADTRETFQYISELEMLFKRYLINCGKSYEHYLRVKNLMKIMLTWYSFMNKESDLDETKIEIISKAGFFCDIGIMFVPPETADFSKTESSGRDSFQEHTILGAEMIRLNHLDNCRYFIDICSDICMHHHERYDGKGYPHKISGKSNLLYTQICRLAENFDLGFYPYQEHNGYQFDLTFKDIERDKGLVSEQVMKLLADSRQQIIDYYQLIE